MKTTTLAGTISIVLSLLSVPAAAVAQLRPIPFHRQLYSLESGAHEGRATETAMAFREVARVPGAPWLQLHFAEHNLGTKSYVTIMALKDGDRQRLDARSLPEWGNSTAYFNGDAVQVTLHVAPGERNIFIRIGEVTVGEWESAGPRPETICGTTDDRVASNDPRVGRIAPVGCTGWIVSNGAHLTAGHCTPLGGQMLQFNVPPSQADGTIVAPAAQDQYPVTGLTPFSSNGTGDDWAVFDTARNSNTGLLPIEAQAAFYRMSRDTLATVRVTGYGTDGPGPSPGCPTCDFGGAGPRNADNQTQQTHGGIGAALNVVNPNNVRVEYQVDTQGGNSGSPIAIDGTTLAVGIHTAGGCTATAGTNVGTSFEHDGLENAISGFGGVTNVRYVDGGHPNPLQDGTVMRPFHVVLDGVGLVPTGGVVSIVSGTYPETLTIDRSMTLSAPVGPVRIGP